MDDKYLHDVVYRLPEDVLLNSDEMYKILMARKYKYIYSKLALPAIDEEERIIENIDNKDFESMDIDVEYLKTTMNEIIFNSENLLFYVKKLNSPTVYAAFLFEKIETLRSDLREIEKHITEGSLEAPIGNTYILPELKIYLKAYLTGVFEILRFKFDLDLVPNKFMYIK